MALLIAQKAGKFLASWAIISFSRMILYYGVNYETARMVSLSFTRSKF
jgi:hypothetical protein